MLPLFCIVLCVICWGLWGVLDKKALETSSSQSVIVTHYILHSFQIPVFLLLLNHIQPGWHLSLSTVFWSGLAAMAYVVAEISYVTAMSKADASFVLGTTASYPVISVALSTLLLGETLVIWRLIGAAIVCGGVIAMSLPEKRAVCKQRMERIVLISIVCATIAWSIWGIIDKAAVTFAGPLEVCLGKYIWDLILLPFVWGTFRKQGHQIRILEKRNLIFCGGSALCLAVGGWCYLSAMTFYSASYVIAITACYPVLMYLLALVFLNEKFNRLRSIGIVLIVAGVSCVQLGQNDEQLQQKKAPSDWPTTADPVFGLPVSIATISNPVRQTQP
jgi:drug/metabolite transporter (DMT)-like permease